MYQQVGLPDAIYARIVFFYKKDFILKDRMAKYSNANL